MNFLQLLAVLAALGQKYGPLGIKIATYLQKGDWAGLLAYLQTLGKPVMATEAGPHPSATELDPVIAAIQAHCPCK